jgi:hypothetical protein
MDMKGGNPLHFHTNGMLRKPRMEEYVDDLWNYMYRTFLSHIVVAKNLGAEKHVEILKLKPPVFFKAVAYIRRPLNGSIRQKRNVLI